MSNDDGRIKSVIFSDEEKRYYRALLAWSPNDVEDHIEEITPERPVAGQFRVLILGSKGCGKTAILTRFCKGSFTRESQPERSRGFLRKVEIKGQIYAVDALEFTPDQLFEGEYLRHAVAITEAAVLVYDVRSRDSFVLIQELRQKVQESLMQDKRQHYGLVLVGNKADGDGGEDDAEEEGRPREVTEGEGYELACNIGYGRTRCAFREASARTGENVDDLFVLLGTELLRARRLAQQYQELEAETDEGAVMRLPGTDGHDEKSPKRRPRWRVWARFRRVSNDPLVKIAVD